MKQLEFNKEVIYHAIDLLETDTICYEGIYGCDFQNELFNMDYFVVGYYQAERFIERYGGSWKAIHRVKNYEKEMFGEVTTDLSDCEKVANMLAYIEGESALMECETIKKCWDKRLTTEDIESLINELSDLT